MRRLDTDKRRCTHEVIQNRGMNCEMRCVLCTDCPLETAQHLFIDCVNARQVWSRFQHLVQFRFSIMATWDASWVNYCQQTGHHKRGWATIFMAVLWSIWRQRNEAIFRSTKLTPWMVASRAAEEARLWSRYCGKNRMFR